MWARKTRESPEFPKCELHFAGENIDFNATCKTGGGPCVLASKLRDAERNASKSKAFTFNVKSTQLKIVKCKSLTR